MYNIDFLRSIIPIPDYINVDNLFNVSYCIETGEVKLYFLSNDFSFLYKCSQDGKIEKQYDASKYKFDYRKFEDFTGYCFDFDDLVIDTVEENIYYIYVEESGYEQYIRLLEMFVKKSGITNREFFERLSEINKKKIETFSDIYDYKAVSMVKIPINSKKFKTYSRPFFVGNNYELSQSFREFLKKAVINKIEVFDENIKNMWVSYDYSSHRHVISTQNDRLKKNF